VPHPRGDGRPRRLVSLNWNDRALLIGRHGGTWSPSAVISVPADGFAYPGFGEEIVCVRFAEGAVPAGGPVRSYHGDGAGPRRLGGVPGRLLLPVPYPAGSSRPPRPTRPRRVPASPGLSRRRLPRKSQSRVRKSQSRVRRGSRSFWHASRIYPRPATPQSSTGGGSWATGRSPRAPMPSTNTPNRATTGSGSRSRTRTDRPIRSPTASLCPKKEEKRGN
jgi:hypothetical protein